ncbi:hypothetical protein EK21DRAFT_84991 [Setomelanomma holmii]|uniref:C2H2-type domain-containing protein n=1 Tax=Setomelanomma holmii TaxID=210430 RepID=A0A9P4HGQ4_9PLEO|nr:hypothetical protein EK21DRAFT_84991 [Setomelanomma holmii]
MQHTHSDEWWAQLYNRHPQQTPGYGTPARPESADQPFSESPEHHLHFRNYSAQPHQIPNVSIGNTAETSFFRPNPNEHYTFGSNQQAAYSGPMDEFHSHGNQVPQSSMTDEGVEHTHEGCTHKNVRPAWQQPLDVDVDMFAGMSGWQGHSQHAPSAVPMDRYGGQPGDDILSEFIHYEPTSGIEPEHGEQSASQDTGLVPLNHNFAARTDMSPMHFGDLATRLAARPTPQTGGLGVRNVSEGHDRTLGPWNPMIVVGLDDNSHGRHGSHPGYEHQASSTRASTDGSSVWTCAGTTDPAATDTSFNPNPLDDSVVTLRPPDDETSSAFVVVNHQDGNMQPLETISQMSAEGFLLIPPQTSPTLSAISLTPSHVDQPLACQDCGNEFSGEYRRGNLQRHMRLKHSLQERLCPCEVCGKVFQRQDARLKHYRNRHPALSTAPARPRPARVRK